MVPVLVRIAGFLRMVDIPAPRKVHQAPIPRVGGIAIIAGALLPLFMWMPTNPQVDAYLAGALLLAFFGVLDDRFDLDYRLKFLGQFIVAIIVIAYGDLVIRRIPFLDDGVLLSDVFAVPLTIFFIIGVTNAINLADGLDGLAGGTSLIAIGTAGLLAYRSGEMALVIVALSIVGATLGFLRYNTHPASVFMGDSGSQFLGFSAAVLMIPVAGTPDCVISPVVPLLVLGVPIFDTLAVMVRRILDKRSPFSPDRAHIHHKLLDRGFSQYEAVVLIYGAQLLLALVALMYPYAADGVLLGFYIAFVISSITILRMARKFQWNSLGWHGEGSPVNTLVGYMRRTRVLARLTYSLLLVFVPAYLVGGAILAHAIDRDFGLSALLGFLLLVFAMLSRRVSVVYALRPVAFLAATFIPYLVESSLSDTGYLIIGLHVFFAGVAILVAVLVRLGGARPGFKANTLDYLVVGIAFIVPNLLNYQLGGKMLGAVVVEAVILFYAIEILLSTKKNHCKPLVYGVLASLGIVALRGFL